MKITLTIIIFLLLCFCITACKNTLKQKEIIYPRTTQDSTTNEYFGSIVADPYFWLEDLQSEATLGWVDEQNQTTQVYLSQIPYRKKVKKRIESLWNYEKYSLPFAEGGYTYYRKNDGLQNQSVLYRRKGSEAAELFIDPNTFSKEGTTSLSRLSFSPDGSLLAYGISKGGSDWQDFIVISTKDKQQVGDTLHNIKFSAIAWKKNEGFFYSTYRDITENRLSSKTSQHRLYYHQLNTPQQGDLLVFGDKEEQRHRYVSALTTEDKEYLVLYAANSTYGNKLYIRKLNSPIQSAFKVVVKHEKSESRIVSTKGSTLWIETDLKTPNKKLVTSTYEAPTPQHWKTVISEKNMPLSISTAGGYFFAHYMKDARSLVKQYDSNGKIVRTLSLPGVGTARGFQGKKEDKFIYFSYTNYITPPSTYTYGCKNGKSEVYHAPNIDFNKSQYVSEQHFYQSKDGTKIPIVISYKKGVKKDGQNPLLLYGYGGFNISIRPQFSPSYLVWLERGGILAVPNLRGGGEYGENWHKAGTKLNKQNVFDDFISAAEYLIEQGYTSSKLLAIKGRSNGGLLVGACLTQRPSLFQVALPQVGVLDMLRYHHFTAGAGWASDYGTTDESEEMFRALYAYSPLHNVSSDSCYPATLISTANYDDRVVPSHSYKFAAELQFRQSCKKIPTLLSVQTKSGHGTGISTKKRIKELANEWSFVWWNMGYKSLPKKP